MLSGELSKWFGYLQSLQDTVVDLPIFWEPFSDDRHRSFEGDLNWLRGTEVDKYLKQTNDTRQAIDDYYFGVAEPLLLQHARSHNILPIEFPHITGFYRAYSLVSSRAFIVDAFHGLSMVPIADAFNHSLENQVHLETDFSVCFHCGSLDECMHDNEIPKTKSNAAPIAVPYTLLDGVAEQGPDVYYEMVANGPILPCTEVFNTYGETLTNAELLLRYGFILDMNDNDHLSWDLRSIIELFSDRVTSFSELKALLFAVVEDWEQSGAADLFSESNLIYYRASRSEETLSLNGDGKISHQLWTLLALIVLPSNRCRFDDKMLLLEELWSLLELQLSQEIELKSPDNNVTLDQRVSRDSSAPALLVNLASLVIELCAFRRRELGRIGDDKDVYEIFDTLPSEKRRTRCALTIIIGEMSLLDSCRTSWHDILTGLSE